MTTSVATLVKATSGSYLSEDVSASSPQYSPVMFKGSCFSAGLQGLFDLIANVALTIGTTSGRSSSSIKNNVSRTNGVLFLISACAIERRLARRVRQK